MPDFKTESQPSHRSTTEDPQAIRTMHDVFSDWERRAILYCLQTRSGEASIECVARHLAAWRQGDVDPVSTDDDAVDRVRNRVVYSHVQKMDEFDIISFDPCDETIKLPDDMEVSVSPPWNQDGSDT